MLITDPCVVSLLWTLSDAQGQAIDELDEPMEFYFGGDDLLPKVEEALERACAEGRSDAARRASGAGVQDGSSP